MSRPVKRRQMMNLDRFQELCLEFDDGCKGYGYAGFKREVGISHSSIGKVLYNGCDFSIENLVTISKETGVSIDWLMGLSDVKYLPGVNHE